MTAIDSTPLIPSRLEHLLVPLDGSRLAEAILPAALELAGRAGASVTLLHVMERGAPATVHGDRHLHEPAEATVYLASVAARFTAAGISVVEHVHPNLEGDVAASIAAHAAEFTADLIALCTHGRAGPRGWLAGSLAQQVIRRVAAPILLVRPSPEGQEARFTPRAVLVALDGTAESEQAVPPALAFARALRVRLRLVVVVATLTTVPGDRAAAARLTPAATSAALDLEQETAQRYLDHLAARLPASVAVETAVGRGDSVRMVLELAARDDQTMLALATHGRAGFDALWAGSVGARVITRASGPLLLVPAKQSGRS